jgi:hypothetical protein
MKKIIYYIALALFTVLIGSISKCSCKQKENERLSDNIAVLFEKIEHYKVNDSLNAAGINRLLLTKSELEKYNADLTQTVKDLNIKLKRVQSLSTTATVTNYEIKTIFKDSIIYKENNVIDTIQCVNYNDNYLSFAGCNLNNTATFKIKSRDTLIQVVHRIPKRFLFFRFGCKAIRQEILSKNPHSEIVFTEYIELK